MLNGILIGNMGLATTLGVISMVPSIFFAAFGAKYVGKKGSKKGIVTWTCISMAITSVLILFFIFTDTRQIGVMGSWNMIVYVLLTLLQNGSNMCITTSNTSYMADTIDYELDRSGRYIPAVVSGTYSLIDKLITSVAAIIATGAVAILGYTTTMPQPTDAGGVGIRGLGHLLDDPCHQVRSADAGLAHYPDGHAGLSPDQGGNGQRPEAHRR